MMRYIYIYIYIIYIYILCATDIVGRIVHDGARTGSAGSR